MTTTPDPINPARLAAAMLLENAHRRESPHAATHVRTQRLHIAIAETLAACTDLLREDTAALPPLPPDVGGQIVREATRAGFMPD